MTLAFLALAALGLAMIAVGIWTLRARLWESEGTDANLTGRIVRVQGWAMILFGAGLTGFAVFALTSLPKAPA